MKIFTGFNIDGDKISKAKPYFYKDNIKYEITSNEKPIELKLAIVGSRSINNEVKVEDILQDFKYIFGIPSLVISGGAKGIDTFGEQWAIRNNIKTQIFKPDWAKYGKRAGFIRNEDIIKNCDLCLAIWDGESQGTKHDMELCEKYKKDLLLFNIKESFERIFNGFYYKQYNNELEINYDGTVQPQQQKRQIYNRWLPQQGIISLSWHLN